MLLTGDETNKILQDVRTPYFEWLSINEKEIKIYLDKYKSTTYQIVKNFQYPNILNNREEAKDNAYRTIYAEKIDQTDPNNKYKYLSELYGNKDAENWEKAKESYEEYKKFDFSFNEPEKGLQKIGSKGWYSIRSSGIRITADILTNVALVYDKNIQRFNDIDRLIGEAFLRCSYTIGNMSPVWGSYSPTGNNYLDTVWHKLGTTDYKSSEYKNTNITKRDDYKEKINARGNENYFMILDIDSPKETIRQLHLQDYFDHDWKLRHVNPNIEEMEKEEANQFIIDTTKLIIQRGYRIIKNYYGDKFTKKQKDEIKELFNEVFGKFKDNNKCYNFEPIHCEKYD